MLRVSANNTQSVCVTHTTLPALDNDNGITNGQGLELQSLHDSPLDTLVDILLPVDLLEIGLGLREQEGVHTTIQMGVAGGGGVSGDHEDGANRAVLGQQTGRLARGGQNNNTTSTQVERSTNSSHGARLNGLDGTLDKAGHFLEVGDVRNGVLSLEGGGVHLPDRLSGVSTLGSLTRQHDAVGTIGDSVTNIADLGTGRAGVLDHGLEHLSGADDRLASQVAHGNHLLLGGENLSSGNLNTEITTGDHDTIGLLQNLGEVVKTLAVLNLGNDLNVLAILTENGADVSDVLGATNERGKDHVDSVLDTEAKIVLVLLRESGQIDVSVGQVDTLAGGDESVVASADLDGLLVLDAQHIEAKDTVVDVDNAAGLDHLGDVLVVDVPLAGLAWTTTEKKRSLGQLKLPMALKCSGKYFSD